MYHVCNACAACGATSDLAYSSLIWISFNGAAMLVGYIIVNECVGVCVCVCVL